MADITSERRVPYRGGRALDLALFLAIMSTAVALGGALAHLLELPGKIALDRERYFIVQRIYDGWWQLAYVLGLQFVTMLAALVMARDRPRVRSLVVAAILGLVAAQAVFWIWTQPANAATANWTVQPENWEALRRQWEYSHAAGALLQLGVMAALVAAALSSSRVPPSVPA